jgi:sulfate adenylyltransferase subunit 1
MDILRIATAGSVDDGKSTLIGRLLYDTRSVAKDKLEAVEASSRRKGLDFVDLSLLTDGLIAEREQGITIDVAHIYFFTEKRKYIIADTPGHIEYTRNMITGASNAEASIVLIDARNGVVEQTRRHLFISSLLRLNKVFVCVNKMDLVQYDPAVFEAIRSQVNDLVRQIGFEGSLEFIPIVAKEGDNIVHASRNMNWYRGETLLALLEALPVHVRDESLPARFPVQYVIRPHSDQHHDFRGYAGKLLSGVLRKGDAVSVLPSQKSTQVKAIHLNGENVDVARAGESIVVELESDVDISRGDMVVKNEGSIPQASQFNATINWMDEQPLMAGRTYLLQHGTNRTKAKILSLNGIRDIGNMEAQTSVQQFRLNDIGTISLKTAKPVFADLFKENPRNGAFILIDEFSNNTVGVGFIG